SLSWSGRLSRFRQRPPRHTAALGTKVAVGHLEETVGAGGEDLVQVAVEVLEVEEGHGETGGDGLLVHLLMAEHPVGGGHLPAALQLLLAGRMAEEIGD